MSLREYMDFVDATGMTPLVGVNYNNHGHVEWTSEKESIERAVRQAEYVANTRGYKVQISTDKLNLKTSSNEALI